MFLITTKEMSIFAEKIITMNLHEKCLIKYLINPLDLFNTMELLKMNNDLLLKTKTNPKFENCKTIKA